MIEAIQNKYDDIEFGSDENSFIQVYVSKSGPAAGPKASSSGNLKLPARLTVDGLDISTVGDEEKLAKLCENVRELDLTKNLITDWKEVFKILKHIPCLKFLNLTKNNLIDKTLDCVVMETYPNLQDLVLNDTAVSWGTVAKVLPCFPSLTELHLSLNDFKHVELPTNLQHLSLTRIFLNGCDIQNWSDLSEIGYAFPNLESLNIIQTNIETLSNDDKYEEFAALCSLNISESKIKCWDEIDKFRRFPSLTSLRISDVPFFEEWEPKLRRQHLVARLPNIKQLNGSTISETEREDAERAFVRFFMDKTEKPNRYFELEQLYGKLDPLVHVDLTPRKTINLLVKFDDKAEFMDISLHQTVAEFKKLLQNFTGLQTSQFRVFYVENLEGKYCDMNEMKLPNRTLLSYNMNVGDEIHIDKKDK